MVTYHDLRWKIKAMARGNDLDDRKGDSCDFNNGDHIQRE